MNITLKAFQAGSKSILISMEQGNDDILITPEDKIWKLLHSKLWDGKNDESKDSNCNKADVRQQSELLSCPNCCSGDVYKAVNEDKYRCMECRHEWATNCA